MTDKQKIKRIEVIRIDSEVLQKLEEKAIEYKMVFQPPNNVLRKLLGLDVKEVRKHLKRGRPRTA